MDQVIAHRQSLVSPLLADGATDQHRVKYSCAVEFQGTIKASRQPPGKRAIGINRVAEDKAKICWMNIVVEPVPDKQRDTQRKPCHNDKGRSKNKSENTLALHGR